MKLQWIGHDLKKTWTKSIKTIRKEHRQAKYFYYLLMPGNCNYNHHTIAIIFRRVFKEIKTNFSKLNFNTFKGSIILDKPIKKLLPNSLLHHEQVITCMNSRHNWNLCLMPPTAAAPAQLARASPRSVFPGAGVRQRSGHRPECHRAAGRAVGQWGRSTSQHLQLRLQVIQWHFVSAKQHGVDVRERLYIFEGATKTSCLFPRSQLLVP